MDAFRIYLSFLHTSSEWGSCYGETQRLLATGYWSSQGMGRFFRKQHARHAGWFHPEDWPAR